MMNPTDEAIKKDIVDEIYWDNRIDASRINVTVENGVVTLAGEVPDHGALVAAESAAWRMLGVNDVVPLLSVVYPIPPELPTDIELEERINNLIAWDTLLDESTLAATVTGGVLTLEGSVDAYWKKSLAQDKVRAIRGIVDVDNKLTVVPSRQVTDEIIADDIVAAMERDPQISPESIHVAVNEGVVTLTGTADSWAERLAALEAASLTTGVIRVINNIQLWI